MVEREAGSNAEGPLIRDEETEAQLILRFEHAVVKAWLLSGGCGNVRSWRQ